MGGKSDESCGLYELTETPLMMKNCRTSIGMTQEKLAEKANTTCKVIQEAEKTGSDPYVSKVNNIVRATNHSVCFLCIPLEKNDRKHWLKKVIRKLEDKYDDKNNAMMQCLTASTIVLYVLFWLELWEKKDVSAFFWCMLGGILTSMYRYGVKNYLQRLKSDYFIQGISFQTLGMLFFDVCLFHKESASILATVAILFLSISAIIIVVSLFNDSFNNKSKHETHAEVMVG